LSAAGLLGRAAGWSAAGLVAVAALRPTGPLAAQGREAAPPGPLTVFAAGSLARPFRALLERFRAAHAEVETAQENSGSLEAARKLTALGRVPDVLAVADEQVLTDLLMPTHATWYATFAGSRMGLLYSPRSAGAAELDGRTWWRVLLRPGVRTGRSDPRLDPAGYRALMVGQLAEGYYHVPGLAARLAGAVRPGDVRPKSADLIALVQAGELDYAWGYEAVARGTGLRFLALPSAIDLGDPARAAEYARARVRVPAPRREEGGGGTTLELRGAPIAYALTIPIRAPHPARARAFVRYVLSAEGRAVLAAQGFGVPAVPTVTGPAPAGLVATAP
jgi:molybdate/tungstate transport system substrate-binding protein